MNKALFLDLDGTVIITKSGRAFPLHSDDWKLIPEMLPFIKEKIKQNYIPIIVTNQAGIELGYLTEQTFINKIENICYRLEYYLKIPKNTINYWYCKEAESYNRKPNIGMAIQAAEEYELNFSECIMVGDMESDKEFARNCGMTYISVEKILTNAQGL